MRAERARGAGCETSIRSGLRASVEEDHAPGPRDGPRARLRRRDGVVRVTLASAPTITEYRDLTGVWDDENRRVPLTVLVLASALEGAGFEPRVLDLDAHYVAWIERGGTREGFVDRAADDLAGHGADVYGLSTICSSYPLTLRIASALKRRVPSSTIVLGGPQATPTDVETLRAFPAVDLVVRGEADGVLPQLISTLEAGQDLRGVRGLTLRRDGTVERTPDSPLVEDLDTLRPAAYHLSDGIRHRHSLPVEAGRGCPFGCTFCSTSRFFGRRFRTRSPGRIVEDMVSLHRAYGVRRFELVHDNFTVDVRWVRDFCGAVSSCGLRLRWTCSSRTDSVDAELLSEMRRAGCRGVFFGVESGSATVQRSIGKRLDLPRTRELLGIAGRRRIHAVVSFIAGFPEETAEDLGATVDLFVEALRFESLEPQLGILSPLSGTPLYRQHREELFLDEVLPDMAWHGEQDDADRVLVARHPEIFSSFYAVPARWLDRRDTYELRSFLLAFRGDIRWLAVLAARLAGGGMKLFDAFRRWRTAQSREWTLPELDAYYRGPRFCEEFTQFVREDVALRASDEGPPLSALASLFAEVQRAERDRERGLRVESPARGFPRRPRLAPGVVLFRVGFDGAALILGARRGADLSHVPRRDSLLVARRRRGRLEVLHPEGIASDLLALCDGTRDEEAVARAFAQCHPEVGGVEGEEACAVGLSVMVKRGLIAG